MNGKIKGPGNLLRSLADRLVWVTAYQRRIKRVTDKHNTDTDARPRDSKATSSSAKTGYKNDNSFKETK
jgi:hypothetical protein